MKGGRREGAGRKPGSTKTEARRDVVRVRLSVAERSEIARCLLITGGSESEFIRAAIEAWCQKHL